MATATLTPYGALSAEVNIAMDELQQQAPNVEVSALVPALPAEELFRLEDSVQIFFIGGDGRVSTFSEPSTLRIFKFSDDNDGSVFIQVGGWTHPLLPGASPVLEAANGAFMFPDVYTSEAGGSVGIVLVDHVDGLEERREQLRKVLDAHTALRSDALLPEDQRLGRVGKTIVKGAELMACGMEKGAIKACSLIEYVGERQKGKMPAAEIETKVSPAIKYSISGAKYATHATVKVSGFVATRVGKLTKSLANYMATQIEKPISGAVVGTTGGNTGTGSTMRTIVDAARGGLVGYGTIYAGLEESAKVLGAKVKEQSVGVVQHAYGKEAGGVADNAASAAGNAAMTYLNVQSLGVKGLVKRTAKDTAKGVGVKVLDAHVEGKKQKVDAVEMQRS